MEKLIDITKKYEEDVIRDLLNDVMGIKNLDRLHYKAGTGQTTSLKSIFTGVISNRELKQMNTLLKPDGWCLPLKKNGRAKIDEVAIVFETKAFEPFCDGFTEGEMNQIKKYVIAMGTVYSKVIGILWDGHNIYVVKFMNGIVTVLENEKSLQTFDYYKNLFDDYICDSTNIRKHVKDINDILHFDFGIQNYVERMIFTVSALVAKKYGAVLNVGMDFETFKGNVIPKLVQLPDTNNINKHLIESFKNVKMNMNDNQEAIDNFINHIDEIKDDLSSRNWNGEDVMAIFFNEFNKYKTKRESGQVFTPDNIASLICKLIDIQPSDKVFDGTCGCGTFNMKSMQIMTNSVGGRETTEGMNIVKNNIYGIEFDKSVCAFAYANTLIHHAGEVQIVQGDCRTGGFVDVLKDDKKTKYTSGEWISSLGITKVTMNPPFEKKYGCLKIVENVLDNVERGAACAFIMPDKKLEKEKGAAKRILEKHRLIGIIKLPTKTFTTVNVTTSVFIFEAKVPHNKKKIFTCYIKDDGLSTVKNMGRNDVHGKWREIEEYWLNVWETKSGDDTVKWINPDECLSYQEERPDFQINEEDFRKTVMDYLLFERGIDSKEFRNEVANRVLYSSIFDEKTND